MDSQSKSGKVYLQPHKPGRKWKPVWLSLFPSSSSAAGRLEIQYAGGGAAGGDTRRHHQPHGDRKLKVVRLCELISVLRLPPNAEACPTENMSAFCVETQDRTMVFAAVKDECLDWVDKLCHSTFQRGGGSASSQLHMEENQIYASADEAPDFWVVIQRSDAAARCGLQGSYWLQVGQEALVLREPLKKNTVREWPYELLRRYGKDKLALTIEAGRRCDSGPGTFIFETQQVETIFSLIQSTIRRKTSGNQNQDGEKVMVPNIRAHSPLPKIPDLTSMAAILEDKLRTQVRRPPTPEDGAEVQQGPVSPSECAAAPPAPITLMPLPLVPTHDGPSAGHHGGQSDAVYADPADCLKPVLKPQPSTAQYVDPASVLPLIPPSSREPVTPPPPASSAATCCPDPVYSEVYDSIGTDRNRTAPLTKGETKSSADGEPIYTEPVSHKERESQTSETKPDPFTHLYARVHKTAPPSGPSSSPNTSSSTSAASASGTTTDESLDDIIYENLGVI
ncbi:docking protein 3 [Embiotoca jacksoni]|uniref:docking protein 3 n=1 Tax=Embiotoca jacksoni TaxID=100190 RepID=UPI003704B7A2